MPDVYSTISDVDPKMQERLADIIEMRAADPQQQAMLRAYLSEIAFPSDAKVIEIGCGTGAMSRTLAQWPGVGDVIGVDPSPVFIARARTLAQGISNVNFEESDGRSLRFEGDSFDVAVIHTTLSHVPQPERLIAEAHRVLRPQGWIAVFDGDYSTATVAIGVNDPLQSCVYAFRENFVNDSWVVRRLPQLLQTAGFTVMPMRSYGYVESPEGAYMLTWIERGADTLVNAGHISKETAEALKAEAQRRSVTKTWFSHIAFASILGRKLN